MNKTKFISTALLLAAGTAFADAASVVWTSNPTSNTTNKGAYGGWTVIWNGSTLTTTSEPVGTELPDTVNLDSITVKTPNDRSDGRGTSGNFKLAIYTINTTLANTLTLDSFVGLSTNDSGAWATNQDVSFNFSGVELSTNTRYAFLFVKNTATDDNLSGDSSADLATNFNQQKTDNGMRVVVTTNSNGDRIYSTAPLSSGSFSSNITIGQSYKTSIVPEPSAFGLLAGLGALALVASRRRRSRKAA